MLEVTYLKHSLFTDAKKIVETMTQFELAQLIINNGMITILSVNRIQEDIEQ